MFFILTAVWSFPNLVNIVHLLRRIAILFVMIGAIPVATLVRADTARTPAVGPACDPADQLTCACDAAQVTANNDFATLCFLGSVQMGSSTLLDQLAVTAFSALNVPMATAAPITRGLPDFNAPREGASVAPGDFRDYVPVWESWRATSDIFRSDAQPPVAWGDVDVTLPAACKGLTVTDAVKAEYAWAGVPESPLPPRVLEGYRNPQGDVLIDAAGQPVRFEVLYNHQAYDYVAQNNLWSQDGLASFIAQQDDGKLSFPSGSFGDIQNETRGAIIAKAAWKTLDQIMDKDGNRFHKAWAFVTPILRDGIPVEGCEIVPVGLVGLHLMLKVGGLDDWLWSTFEHQAMAPEWDTINTGPKGVGNPDWLFSSGSHDCEGTASVCPKMVARNTAPVLSTLHGTPHPAFDPLPSRLIRLQPPVYYRPGQDRDCSPFLRAATGQFTTSVSDCIQAELENTYTNSFASLYVFKGAQWRNAQNSGKDASGKAVPFLTPENLANTALESFNQADSNCYSCHLGAGSPAPGFEGFDPNPDSAVFDFIFGFKNIQGMPASGSLP